MPAYPTYVNLHQTKEDRRAKYRTCRANGFNINDARRYRDWHWKQILAVIANKERHETALKFGLDEIKLLAERTAG
jgi:hypothetical protein